MLTRRAKVYSSFCSQTVSLSPAISLILKVCAKINLKNPYFESLKSFKVIDVNMTEKLVTSACCNRQHAHAYLQPFSRKLANNGKTTIFTGVPLFDVLVRRFS